MEECTVECVDFGQLTNILPTCIKLVKMIHHCIHKLSYTDAFLNDVYHDMNYLKTKLLVRFESVSMNESLAVIGERIDEELLKDEFLQVSALLNPSGGCPVVKRSHNIEES